MGRFDALTQLEEKQEQKIPLPVIHSPVSTSQPKKQKHLIIEKKPARLQTIKLTNPHHPISTSFERPEKYTTHLEPSLVKKLKLHAAERDMKDYQVIKKALLLYFEEFDKNK